MYSYATRFVVKMVTAATRSLRTQKKVVDMYTDWRWGLMLMYRVPNIFSKAGSEALSRFLLRKNQEKVGMKIIDNIFTMSVKRILKLDCLAKKK